MGKQFRDHCQYCGGRLPHAAYEDGIIECRNRLFDRVTDLEMELDVHKAGVAVDKATRHVLSMTVREACRRALAIDGADAQALEGALQQVERELAQTKDWASSLAEALTHQTAEADAARGRADRAEAALVACGRAGCPSARDGST